MGTPVGRWPGRLKQYPGVRDVEREKPVNVDDGPGDARRGSCARLRRYPRRFRAQRAPRRRNRHRRCNAGGTGRPAGRGRESRNLPAARRRASGLPSLGNLQAQRGQARPAGAFGPVHRRIHRTARQFRSRSALASWPARASIHPAARSAGFRRRDSPGRRGAGRWTRGSTVCPGRARRACSAGRGCAPRGHADRRDQTADRGAPGRSAGRSGQSQERRARRSQDHAYQSRCQGHPARHRLARG